MLDPAVPAVVSPVVDGGDFGEFIEEPEGIAGADEANGDAVLASERTGDRAEDSWVTPKVAAITPTMLAAASIGISQDLIRVA